MQIIEIKNITKDYGNGKGVFDVNFNVNKGEVLGFLGPNGAGKTTTIRQLMGFVKPDKGSLYINGKDCFTKSAQIQKTLGYLPGEIAYMDDMRGMEFIKFIAKMKGLKDLSCARELISDFELDTNGKIKKMSKGMKQKLGIVCAFMNEPEILILDEPTSGLDPLMQNKFLELILHEKKNGKTILMSSHIFEEVEKTCDRAAIIKEGRIVAVEDMENLRQNRMKVIEVKFENKVAATQFAARSMEKCSCKNDVVTLQVTGNMDKLIKALSFYTIKDINVKTQSLEELFMHFYGGDN